MSIQRNLQKCMEDWKQISGLDFCLLSEDNSVFVATGERRIPSAGKLENFRNGDALCTANASCCLYKVMDRDELLYILIVWGSKIDKQHTANQQKKQFTVSSKDIQSVCRYCVEHETEDGGSFRQLREASGSDVPL